MLELVWVAFGRGLRNELVMVASEVHRRLRVIATHRAYRGHLSVLDVVRALLLLEVLVEEGSARRHHRLVRISAVIESGWGWVSLELGLAAFGGKH